MDTPLDQLIAVWRETAELHELRRPCEESDLVRAEAVLGSRLPRVFKDLYRFSNGLSLNKGSLVILPLFEEGARLSLVSMSDQLREWQWPIPEDVVVFGDNGCGEPYGLWIGPHDSTRFPEPIVIVGEIFEPGSMGLYSQDLISFLLEETSEGLRLAGREFAIHENFGLGKDSVLRQNSPVSIESSDRDPYRACLDAAGIERLLR